MPSGRRSPIAKPQVVTLALGELGGIGRSVDTEDIAIKAHELAPKYFAWRKYRQYIDLDLVRLSLRHAADDAHGRLVEGSVRTGWSLTDVGVGWYQQERERVLDVLSNVARTHSNALRFENRKYIAEMNRVQHTDAWVSWNKNESVPYRQAAEVFRVDQYTDGRLLKLKIQGQMDLLREDTLVGDFIREMARVVRTSLGNLEAK